MSTISLARDIGGTAQQPTGMHTVGLAQTGENLTPYDFYDEEVQSVEAGNRYCIAAWVGTVNCRAYLFVSFHDAAGGFLGGVLSGVIPDGVPGGTDLSSWTRTYVFGTAPIGAATLRYNVRQMPTVGATTALTRLLRPTIEQALPGQTQPSMWAESANGMRSAFREATDAIADDVHAQSTAIQQLSARLDNGGDVHNALVQVTALAEATATNASGSWGVVVDADGKLAGIKALSDGKTSQIVMSADEVLIDGSLTASKIASGAVSTDKLQAGAVTADKISVGSLSALSASLGTLIAGVIDFTGGAGWQYIRTAGKWLGDTVSGWISAANPSTGDFFQEFRSGSGKALVLERKTGGPNTGFGYLLKVVDAGGVERFTVDPANGRFYFNGNGIFSGALSAASGTFGDISAGYLHNPAGTSALNLNAGASDGFLSAGGKTLIWADGHTTFNNQVYSQTVSVNLQPLHDGGSYFIYEVTDEGTSQVWTYRYANGAVIDIPTGVTYSAATFAKTSFSASVASATYSYGSHDGANDFRVCFDATPLAVPPGPQDTWTGVMLMVRVTAYLIRADGSPIETIGIDAYQMLQRYGGLNSSPALVTSALITIEALT